MDSLRKTVIVTGGSGGIGQQICRKLSQEWNVVVHFHSNGDAAQKLVRELEALNSASLAIQADLANESSVCQMFEQAKDRFGQIHAVVANAGIGGGGRVDQTSLETFRSLMDVNVIGSYLTLREAAKQVSDDGKIVFVSSQLAERPREGTGMYSACKAAIDAMIVSMSHELGSRRICINSIRPGATEPGMFASSSDERKEYFRALSPFGRLGCPQDMANVISFLVSDEAGWITGQHVRVDGGASN